MRLEGLGETAIQILFEKARIQISPSEEYTIYPDIETYGNKFKHGAMRIKVASNYTDDKSSMSSFPIDTSGAFPSIMEDKVVYGFKLTNKEKTSQLNAARATVAYAFPELEDLYNDGTTENKDKFEEKLKEFNKLKRAEKKAYIAMGKGSYD